MKPIVSVIVPVYRTERFLTDCIESILRQSFTNFELILVNDGSPDNSGAICEEYSRKDARIRVLHQENGGVSSARNMGLEKAQGEYIIFADSDDYLGKKHIQELCSAQSMSKESELLVISDYQPFSKNGQEQRSFFPEFTASLCGEKNDPELFRRLVFNFMIFPPYCKLYRRNIIEKYQLRFNTELHSAEDFDFNCRYIQHINKIIYTPSVQYYYRVDYKKYCPSNDGVLGQSEILSAHTMAHGIQEIAERMGVAQEIFPEICLWAANKHYFNRLEMLFVPNSKIDYRERKSLYRQLISDGQYYALAKKGVKYLPMSMTKRIAQRLDYYLVWWMLYRFRQLRAVTNKYQ